MGSGKDELFHIPDKVYFKIGEVCQLTGIKPHTLRLWESEFAIIKPRRASSQQRLYRKIDIENVLRVKKMMYEEGMTVAGTKKYLARQSKNAMKPVTVDCCSNFLFEIKRQLIALQAILK